MPGSTTAPAVLSFSEAPNWVYPTLKVSVPVSRAHSWTHASEPRALSVLALMMSTLSG